MTEKFEFDRIRNRGGMAHIGTAEDGAIEETGNINGRLIVIKERAVYEVKFADRIDPNRENLNLPPVTQILLVRLGTESEVLCRTFLTTKRLVKDSYLPPHINIAQVINLSLDFVHEIDAMKSEIDNYENVEKECSTNYNERKEKKFDHAVPSIPDINTRCKTIFQKADQAYQLLFSIIRLFYSELSNKDYYSMLPEFIKIKHGEKDGFFHFIKDNLDSILLTRNIRNCLDHRRTEIKIVDYDLQLSGEIIAPTIAIDFNGSRIPRMSLIQLLQGTHSNLVLVYETFIALLVSRNLKTDRLMPGEVRVIPEKERKNKYIQYAYWLPLGPGGFYEQK